MLVEVDGRFVTVTDKVLDKITVCRSHETQIAENDRLHLKANRKLASGDRVTNGELVTVKSVRPDGTIKLTDGRVLDSGYREFLPGYAVTSYGSQGKTVDYVLFSDSTVKPATNAQQWYVSISRGRRGIRIFTPDKEQLRENITRRGDRPSVMDLLAERYKNDWFYRLIERRWGKRAAVIMTRSRRGSRRAEKMRQKQNINAPPTHSVVSSWRVVVTLNAQKSMNTKTPECWASDPNARAVKIELSAEQSLLLPFDQFAFAELKSEGKEQCLRLVFATHEVMVRGHSLRRIESTMQRMELSFLIALSGYQRSLIPDGQPVVLEIVAAEAKAAQADWKP